MVKAARNDLANAKCDELPGIRSTVIKWFKDTNGYVQNPANVENPVEEFPNISPEMYAKLIERVMKDMQGPTHIFHKRKSSTSPL